MKKIRIGIDVEMTWSITTNKKAVDLNGRDLFLEIKNSYGVGKRLTFECVGNVAKFTFYGKDQKGLGKYSLTMWENKGKKGQNVVDITNAIELVRTTEEMGGVDEGNLETSIVNLGTSDFSIGSSYDDTGIKREIAEIRKMVEDTHLIGAEVLGGGGANENNFV